jgi:hypothetical protein
METEQSPSPEDKPKAEDELVTITGGIEIEITHLPAVAGRDGPVGEADSFPHKETVKVRQIPISKIQQFALALGNEAELIELYCDKPKGWADTLTVESASAVADKGQEINLPLFAAWFRRQAKWRESQTPGAIAELEKKLTELIVASRLPNSAQPSPTNTD